MANYCATARSNYFRVRNPEAFQNWVESLGGIFFDDPKKGVGFYMEPGDGWPLARLDDDGEYVEFDLTAELAEHLAEGEVAILMQSGAEKIRYITGTAWAVAWDGREICLGLDAIYELAEQAFGIKPSYASY